MVLKKHLNKSKNYYQLFKQHYFYIYIFKSLKTNSDFFMYSLFVCIFIQVLIYFSTPIIFNNWTPIAINTDHSIHSRNVVLGVHSTRIPEMFSTPAHSPGKKSHCPEFSTSGRNFAKPPEIAGPDFVWNLDLGMFKQNTFTSNQGFIILC